MNVLQPTDPLLKIKIRHIIDMIREIFKEKYIDKHSWFFKYNDKDIHKKWKICMAEDCKCVNPMTFIF